MQTTLKQGAPERAQEQGAAGGVRSTKDRDVPALQVRAGRVALGRTSWDVARFLAAPMETELKWPGELSGEWPMISPFCSETEARIRLLLL